MKTYDKVEDIPSEGARKVATAALAATAAIVDVLARFFRRRQDHVFKQPRLYVRTEERVERGAFFSGEVARTDIYVCYPLQAEKGPVEAWMMRDCVMCGAVVLHVEFHDRPSTDIAGAVEGHPFFELRFLGEPDNQKRRAAWGHGRVLPLSSSVFSTLARMITDFEVEQSRLAEFQELIRLAAGGTES